MPIRKSDDTAAGSDGIAYAMPTSGIREAVSYRLRNIDEEDVPVGTFVTGYRDLGNTPNFGTIMYSSMPGILEPHLYTARPRSKHDASKRLQRSTLQPDNILPARARKPTSYEKDVLARARSFLVEHERDSYNLLTEEQTSDQMWWLLRSSGVTSTTLDVLVNVAHTAARMLFEHDPAVRALLRALGINFDNSKYLEPAGTSTVRDPESCTLTEYVSSIASSALALKGLKKTELVQICGFYSLSAVGSKSVLAERIWSESGRNGDIRPISPKEVLMNRVVSTIDAHVYHKPMKGTEYTESGQCNEKSLLRAAAEMFAAGESERVAMGMAPGEKLVFVCNRGLAQSRYCHKLLFSPDGVGVTWRPRTPSELEEIRSLPGQADMFDEEDGGVFSLVIIECKTIHGDVLSARLARMARYQEGKYVRTYLPASDLRPLRDALNVVGDDPRTTDVHRFEGCDRLMSVIGNRSHVSQILSLGAASGIARVLYILGSPNRALQMVDVEQEVSTRRNLESNLGVRICHGAHDRTWPVWGIVCSHFVMKTMREGGAQVLFDNQGDMVPDAVEELSYIQTALQELSTLSYGTVL